ncbi:hypothetical protein [Candidatus Anaplasma sp. TIGMIC]|uniref:hypothetical protein n=1 Tax=Candidatus Anaplasma sp. TIGMIC TaxID=3020713 RepID=UPI00232F0B60|nr:hypothetical protein [Candidatus Anaplasma sp. TIGMIC]MDB1135340.1 hypothetical protein [Candidatus Anaplasma sp. TIGMIC]
MHSLSGIVFSAVFGVVLYVFLTNSVNWVTAYIRKRNKGLRNKSMYVKGHPGSAASTPSTKGSSAPQRFISAYENHRHTSTKVEGVESVSQVFDAGKGKGR